MHFVKAVILFAGIAAAAPAAITTSKAPSSTFKAVSSSTKAASSSTKAVSSSVKVTSSTLSKVASTSSAKATSSTPSKAPSSVAPSVRPSSSSVKSVAPSSTAPASNVPTALVSSLWTDFNAWHASMDDALAALDPFTGGSGIGSQATVVAHAGDVLQSATLQVLTDSKKFSPYGVISVADSAKFTELFCNHIALDAANIFKMVQDKKALFNQVGAVKNVYAGLNALQSEIQQIGQALEPHLVPSDLVSIGNAGAKVFAALQSAISAYAS